MFPTAVFRHVDLLLPAYQIGATALHNPGGGRMSIEPLPQTVADDNSVNLETGPAPSLAPSGGRSFSDDVSMTPCHDEGKDFWTGAHHSTY